MNRIKIYRILSSILVSGVLFGFIKYMVEKEFNTSLLIAALLFGIIFEIVLFIGNKYFKVKSKQFLKK